MMETKGKVWHLQTKLQMANTLDLIQNYKNGNKYQIMIHQNTPKWKTGITGAIHAAPK